MPTKPRATQHLLFLRTNHIYHNIPREGCLCASCTKVRNSSLYVYRPGLADSGLSVSFHISTVRPRGDPYISQEVCSLYSDSKQLVIGVDVCPKTSSVCLLWSSKLRPRLKTFWTSSIANSLTRLTICHKPRETAQTNQLVSLKRSRCKLYYLPCSR